MGAESSTLEDINENSLLTKLTGALKVERDDTFWDKLLDFEFEYPQDREASMLLDASVEKLCRRITTNNHVTGNFTTLVGVFIFHAQDLQINPIKQKSHDDCQKVCNVMLLVRCICKYLVDNLPEQELVRQFNTLPSCEGTRTVFEEYLLTIFTLISTLDVQSATYYIHLEAVNSLIVLLSVQMQELKPTTSSVIHLSVMNSKCSEVSKAVVQKLFQNYIKNHLLPSEDDGSDFLSRTLSTVWSIFGVGPDSDLDALRPLASHSLLLLLILSNQLTKDRNPYREIMFNCRGQSSTLKDDEFRRGQNALKQNDSNLVLNFNSLFRACCRDIPNDQTILLLYLMLHQNEAFMSHMLKRDDLGNLVLPLLEILYNAEERSSHLIYMTLIVLLILSQEEDFSVQMHRTMLHEVEWYKDRKLHGISLGGVLCLVFIRMIQHNIFKMRDKYLHSNCLAALANMSSHFYNLSSIVCDRFVRVLTNLLKRYSLVQKKLKSFEEDLNEETDGLNEEFSDSNVLEEVIRMFLEIINSCIITKLKDNPNLIYALLHEKETMERLQKHPKFQDIMFNINLVLTYFNTRLADQNEDTYSVEAVHLVINKELQRMPVNEFKKFPDLRFKYVEEDQPEEFFVPYIWSIVYKSSNLFWDLQKVALFQFNSVPKDSDT